MSQDLEMQALNPLTYLNDVSSMSDGEIHNFRDNRGFSLLMLASEAGRLDVVQFLIDRGEDVNFEVEGEDAATLAYKGGHHEVVLSLLKANSKFPPSLNLKTCTDEVKSLSGLCNVMHVRVISACEKNFEPLKIFLKRKIEENQSMRHFYDTVDNFSLLKRAILIKKFSIYVFLLSMNVFLGPHETMDEINESLSDDEREKLSEINFRISPNLMTEPMMILMRNCKLSPDSPKHRQGEFMNFIRQAFDDLFMIPAVAIVLRIVAASRNFKIIFDFKRDSVTFLDPKSEPYCSGLMYLNGKIYIGAKDLLNTALIRKVVGVIAHELTHYAMFLVYDNWAKPYKENDLVSKDQFTVISNECERLKEAEELVGLVYDCYDEDMWHAELIVRVPHILSVYSDNHDISNARRNLFESLFNFYEQTCMPNMEAELPNIEKKNCPWKKVQRKLNRQRLWIMSLTILIIFGTFFSVFGIYKLWPVSWPGLSADDKDIFKNSTVVYKGDEVKFGELFASDSYVYNMTSSDVIKDTINGNNEKLREFFKNTLEEHHVYLTWANMTEDLRIKFLTHKVFFQYKEIALKQITTSESTLKLLVPKEVKEIFNNGMFKINSTTEEKFGIYIERYFTEERFKIVSEQFFNTSESKNLTCLYKNGKVDEENVKVLNLDKVSKQIESSGIFLLSSAAGDGKSTAFRYLSRKLKEKFPQKWIQYVDLKQHDKIYGIGQATNLADFNNLQKFLCETLIRLNSDFETEILKDLFASGNVIFLWDGVDEISPRFKDFMLKLTKIIFNTKNFQFISTRPQHSKDFQNNFFVKAYKLIPYSELDRFEFMVKEIATKNNFQNGSQIFELFKRCYRKDLNKSSCQASTLNASGYDLITTQIEKVQKIFKFSENSTQEHIKQDRFVSNPLLVAMICEVSDDENFVAENVTLNSYRLYNRFIAKKLNLLDLKREIVKEGTPNRDYLPKESSQISRIHQYFALKFIGGTSYGAKIEEFAKKLGYNLIEERIKKRSIENEEISHYGILQVNSDEDFIFAHRTFAEFFVAQFFLYEIFTPDKNLDLNRLDDQWKVFLFFESFVNSRDYIVRSFLKDAFNSKIVDFDLTFFENWNEIRQTLQTHASSRMIEVIHFLNFFGMEKFDFMLKDSKCLKMLNDGNKFLNLSEIQRVLGAEFVKSILNYRIVSDVSTPFLCSIQYGTDEDVSQYVDFADRLLNVSEIVSIFTEVRDSHGINPLMAYVSNQKIESIQKFWNFAEKHLNGREKRDFLNQTSERSWTALHHSVENKDPKVFKFLKQIYNETFSLDEMKQIFVNDRTKLSDFINFTISRASTVTGKEIIEYIEELLELKKLDPETKRIEMSKYIKDDFKIYSPEKKQVNFFDINDKEVCVDLCRN